jgi:hypothetical protein
MCNYFLGMLHTAFKIIIWCYIIKHEIEVFDPYYGVVVDLK